MSISSRNNNNFKIFSNKKINISLLNTKLKTHKILKNQYDYFKTKIPKSQIENYLSSIKDEKFLFFINNSILRRYEGDCDIIYFEVPLIPNRIIIYRNQSNQKKMIEKLYLVNKDLPHIPFFEGEEKLKFLSLELNRITRIESLKNLSNLIYLNLYGNEIKEIENLSNLVKLKVLILSNNNISKIKNLNNLINLEIIDLHNNKIQLIEDGLKPLKKLRMLNLSNNLLYSFEQLEFNKNLEELNLKKNNILSIPDIVPGSFEYLHKINLEKNMINRIKYIRELAKLKNINEIIIDYNPVLNNPISLSILKNLPIKGRVSVLIEKNKKNTPYNSPLNSNRINTNNNSNTNIESKNKSIDNKNSTRYGVFEKYLIESANIKLNKSNKSGRNLLFSKNRNSSLKNGNFISEFKVNIHNSNYTMGLFKKNNMINIHPSHSDEKNKFNFSNTLSIYNKTQENFCITNIKNNLQTITSARNKNSNDINFKIKLKIMQIKNNWFNKNIVNGGYANVINENCLVLFGECLNCLNNKHLYKKIKYIHFNYINIDSIINNKQILEYLKLFNNLIGIKFNYNNINSLFQIKKFQSLGNIENITINNNLVCNGFLLKYYLINILKGLKIFNENQISYQEIIISQEMFGNYNNIYEKINKKKEKFNLLMDDNNDTDENSKYIFWSFAKNNLSIALESIFELKG